MKKRINKTAVSIVLLYVILTSGLRMFLISYANSYNKLNEDPIVPAKLTVSSTITKLDILEQSINIKNIKSDSKLYFVAYLLTPDELRAAAVLASKRFSPN